MSYFQITVELDYNECGLCDSSAIALHILWYQVTPSKARVFFFFSTKYIRARTLYITTLPIIRSNIIFQDVGCFGMELNVEKTKVMRISRQPFPVKIIVDQKQLGNVESFKYLGSILTNDGRCTCEIKCRIAMAKAAFNKKGLFLLARCTWN